MMEENVQVIVAGHICLDLFPDLGKSAGKSLQEIFSPGKLTESETLNIRLGGAVPGTALALKKLGIPVTLIAKTGNDLVGEAVLDELRRLDLPTDKIISTDGPGSSYSLMLEIPGYDKIAMHYPGANHFFNNLDLDEATLCQGQVFHFGYPNLMQHYYQQDGKHLAQMFRKTSYCGLFNSLDLAPMDPGSEAGKADWNKIFSRTLSWVHLFAPSAEEILLMLKPEEYHKLAEAHPEADLVEWIDLDLLRDLANTILNFGAGIVVIKCGKNGAFLKTGSAGPGKFIQSERWLNREIYHPAFEIDEVKTTTGCGDNFIAGFLAGLLQKNSPEECLRLASACGALAASNPGFSLNLADISELANHRWTFNEPQIGEKTYRYDPESRIYLGPEDAFFNLKNIPV